MRCAMDSKHEQAMVGSFVLLAGGILVAMVFTLSGAFGGAAKTYHAYFPFAGGLEPGATVRFAGGPKVGRVEKLQLDPKDSSRIEITFSVKSDLPVKTDRKSTRLNSSHGYISYAVFCLKKKKKQHENDERH